MTLQAIDRAVLPLQFKTGFIVIEQDLFPILCRMAALALLSQRALVFILLSMAGDAGRGRGLELIGAMAFFAGDRRMFPFERKASSGVVKTNPVPCLRIMAALAFLSQRTFVFVFLKMA